MAIEIEEWDYTEDPERHDKLIEKLRSIKKFTVLVDKNVDKFILVGEANDISRAEALIMSKSLKRLI